MPEALRADAQDDFRGGDSRVRPCRRGDPTSKAEALSGGCFASVAFTFAGQWREKSTINGRAPCLIRQIPLRRAIGRRAARASSLNAARQEQLRRRAGASGEAQGTAGQGSGGFMRIVAHCADRKSAPRPPRPRQWPPATRRTGGPAPQERQAVRARRQQQTKQGHKQPARTFHGPEDLPGVVLRLFAPGCPGSCDAGAGVRPARRFRNSPYTRREWVVSLSRQPPRPFV